MSNSTPALLNTLQSSTPQSPTPGTSAINSMTALADNTPPNAPAAIFLRELLASLDAIPSAEENSKSPQEELLPTLPQPPQALALPPQILQILPSNGKQLPPSDSATTLNTPLATTEQLLANEGATLPIAPPLNRAEIATPLETALPFAANTAPEVATNAVAMLLSGSGNKGKTAATL
ncbi:MAG: hypothetical protein GXP10_11335, partial [Gammaproteobacteria bacterium]|nr:hypothetical protein [Gammaproteobacteria bacterium]